MTGEPGPGHFELPPLPKSHPAADATVFYVAFYRGYMVCVGGFSEQGAMYIVAWLSVSEIARHEAS